MTISAKRTISIYVISGRINESFETYAVPVSIHLVRRKFDMLVNRSGSTIISDAGRV